MAVSVTPLDIEHWVEPGFTAGGSHTSGPGILGTRTRYPRPPPAPVPEPHARQAPRQQRSTGDDDGGETSLLFGAAWRSDWLAP
jgi:hypothetical protein